MSYTPQNVYERAKRFLLRLKCLSKKRNIPLKCLAFWHICIFIWKLFCFLCCTGKPVYDSYIENEKDLTAIPLTNYYKVRKYFDSVFGWLYSAQACHWGNRDTLERMAWSTLSVLQFTDTCFFLRCMKNICCHKIKTYRMDLMAVVV